MGITLACSMSGAVRCSLSTAKVLLCDRNGEERGKRDYERMYEVAHSLLFS